MARALGVQSREIWPVITGLLSAELEPSKKMENPHVSCFAAMPKKIMYFVATTVLQNLHIKFVCLCGPLQCVCGHCICVSVVCSDTCASV